VDPRGAIGEDIEPVPARSEPISRYLLLAPLMLACGSRHTSSTPSRPQAARSSPPPMASLLPERTPAVGDKNATPSSSARSAVFVAEADTPEARLAFWKSLFQSPRHHPALLDAEPRASRLAPGPYACRVSREYRLRDCRVERTSDGRTLLEVSEGNLLGMRGVLWDEGNTVRFDGWLTDEQPFGCASCQERCYAYPGSCACDPLPPEAIRECLKQPLRISFRPAGAGRYQGSLEYSVYYNEYLGEGSARHAEGYVAKREQFEVLLVKGAPPP
jgi:hypothetical protein